MGRQEVRDQQAGFGSGLNTVTEPAFVRPDQAVQMANFRLSTYGAALKRLGTQITANTAFSTNDTTNGVAGGIYWPSKDTIYIIAGAVASSALTLWKTTYPVPFVATWTAVGALPQYRPVVFTDGTNEVTYWAGDTATHVYKFDGTTISALGSTTAKVAGLCVYNDRLWGWNGGTGLGNALYYSDLSATVGGTAGDSLGDSAAGGGQIVVVTFGFSTIVACGAVNGTLLICHQRGISVLTGWGQSDTAVQPQALNGEVGMGTATASGFCIANESSTGDVAYFVTDLGIYRSNGATVEPLGTPDKPDPTKPLLLAGTVNPSAFILAFNRQYNEVWVQIAGVGVYVYNVILEAWSGPFTGTYASGTRALFEVLEGQGNAPVGTPVGRSRLWRITYDVPTVGSAWNVQECDRAGTYKDDVSAGTATGGTPVAATLQFHRMFAGDRLMSKSFRWVDVLATLTAGATPPTAVCTSPVSGATTVTFSGLTSAEQPYYLQPGRCGPYMDVTITDSGSTGTSQYTLADVRGNFLGQR